MTNDRTPPDHPMQSVWSDNEKMRTLAGLIEYARAGDDPALRTLLGIFISKVRNGKPIQPEVLEFFREVFNRRLNGQSFDEAFYQKPPPHRKPPDSAERLRRAEIAARVGSIKSAEPRRPLDDIAEEVAAEFGIDGRDPGAVVQKIWQAYALPRNRKK